MTLPQINEMLAAGEDGCVIADKLLEHAGLHRDRNDMLDLTREILRNDIKNLVFILRSPPESERLKQSRQRESASQRDVRL